MFCSKGLWISEALTTALLHGTSQKPFLTQKAHRFRNSACFRFATSRAKLAKFPTWSMVHRYMVHRQTHFLMRLSCPLILVFQQKFFLPHKRFHGRAERRSSKPRPVPAGRVSKYILAQPILDMLYAGKWVLSQKISGKNGDKKGSKPR